MGKKILLAGIIAFLFIGIAITPATADLALTESTSNREARTIEQFMNGVETIAAESQTFSEFMQKLQDLCLSNDYNKFPIIQEFLSKMIQALTRDKALSGSGLNVLDLLGSFSLKSSSNYFVISIGAYHRLNPRKENSINHFRERLSMWRYSDSAKLLKGRTLILERHPFGVHQKVLGPQLGFMKGFKGIYLDIESKLTGNSYVFFLGRVHRIRAFDLTPFSK